jgi:hypothetical protein
VSGIKHFRSRLKGRPFQLWTDHKPLIFSLHRVSPSTFGSQQRHLAFISEYTNQLVFLPGTSNVVADVLSRPAAAAAGTVWVCAAIADRSSLDLKDVALRQTSAHRYRLSVPAQGCASSHRRSATLTSLATHPPEFSTRWCPVTFGDRFSNTSTGPPTLAGGRLAASSPPGMYGKVSPQMSPPGLMPAWAASGPRSTAMFRYPLNTFRYPPAVSATSASKDFTYLFTIIDRT